MVEMLKVCRICLEGTDLFPIFKENEELSDIANEITSCLPVTIEKYDGLPRFICIRCREKVRYFAEFRSLSAKSYETLKKLTWQCRIKIDHPEMPTSNKIYDVVLKRKRKNGVILNSNSKIITKNNSISLRKIYNFSDGKVSSSAESTCNKETDFNQKVLKGTAQDISRKTNQVKNNFNCKKMNIVSECLRQHFTRSNFSSNKTLPLKKDNLIISDGMNKLRENGFSQTELRNVKKLKRKDKYECFVKIERLPQSVFQFLQSNQQKKRVSFYERDHGDVPPILSAVGLTDVRLKEKYDLTLQSDRKSVRTRMWSQQVCSVCGVKFHTRGGLMIHLSSHRKLAV